MDLTITLCPSLGDCVRAWQEESRDVDEHICMMTIHTIHTHANKGRRRLLRKPILFFRKVRGAHPHFCENFSPFSNSDLGGSFNVSISSSSTDADRCFSTGTLKLLKTHQVSSTSTPCTHPMLLAFLCAKFGQSACSTCITAHFRRIFAPSHDREQGACDRHFACC